MKKIMICIISLFFIFICVPSSYADSGTNQDSSNNSFFPDAGKYSIGLEWGNEYLGSFYLDSRYWMHSSPWGVDAGIGFGLDYGGGYGFHVEPMYQFYTKTKKFILYADADLSANFGNYSYACYGCGSISSTFYALSVGAGIESDLGRLFDNKTFNNWGVFLQWNPLAYYDFSVAAPTYTTPLGTTVTYSSVSASGIYFGSISAGFHYYF